MTDIEAKLEQLESRISDLERSHVLELTSDSKYTFRPVSTPRPEPEPELIQGYTMEQWQQIIDGEFLCEFRTYTFSVAGVSTLICGLREVKESRFVDLDGFGFKYCRPLRVKGHRQPWFGGECPVDPDALVLVVLRNGGKVLRHAGQFTWEHGFCPHRAEEIIEFIEL